MRCREFLQRAARVEGREQLAVFVLGPRLAGLARHLLTAAVEALDPLERRGRGVQRAHDLWPLVRRLGREDLPAFRVNPVSQTANDCECLGLVHRVAPLYLPCPPRGAGCGGCRWLEAVGLEPTQTGSRARLGYPARPHTC